MKTESLPVVETIYRAFAYVWWLRKRLAVALLPALSILLILDFLSLYISNIEDGPSTALLTFLAFPITILYVITVHRIMILGPDGTKKYGLFEWGYREWRYLFFLIVLSIAAWVPIAIWFMLKFSANGNDEPFLIQVVTAWLPFIPIALAFARVSLVFPATAVDSRLSLRESWEISRGNTLRLSAVIYSIPILTMTVGAILLNILPDAVIQYFDTVTSIIIVLVGYLLYVIEVSCLSFSYKYFVNSRN